MFCFVIVIEIFGFSELELIFFLRLIFVDCICWSCVVFKGVGKIGFFCGFIEIIFVFWFSRIGFFILFWVFVFLLSKLGFDGKVGFFKWICDVGLFGKFEFFIWFIKIGFFGLFIEVLFGDNISFVEWFINVGWLIKFKCFGLFSKIGFVGWLGKIGFLLVVEVFMVFRRM